MEAKVPEAHKGDVDFVKTSIMLKYMLDELISRGCSPEEAMVFGTLLHGNQIFQYQMSLRHSGIYMMQEVFVGFLPTSSKEIDRLVSLVPMMMDIMVCIKSCKSGLGIKSYSLFDIGNLRQASRDA